MISETLRALLAGLREGVVVVGADGAVLAANAAAESLLGLSPPALRTPSPEVRGLFLPDGTTPFPPDSLPLARALRGETSVDVEVFVRNDRVPGLRLSLTGRPVQGADGTVAGGVLICRALEPAAPASDERAKVAAFLDSIVENIPAMIFVKEASELRFELFNRAGEELLGWPREKLLGKNDYDLFPREQADAFQTRDRETLAKRALVDVPEEPIRTGRGERWLHTKKIPILDEAGHPKYLLGISLDVTAKKEAEAALQRAHEEMSQQARELKEANRQLRSANEALALREKERTELYEKLRVLDERKTRFFANVSHELRTPLTLILGPVERLLSQAQTGESDHELLEVIARNAQTLLTHVNDLLDVAKMEAGRMGLHYANVDLAALLRVEASNFDGIARERRHRFLVATPERALAEVDGEKVQRVLVNLLSNAFKFTPPGGTIRCELARDLGREGEEGWKLVVSDSGPGVAPALREAIFDRFVQVEDVPTRSREGTGLGLAIAKDLVELQRGSLRVIDGVDGGAAFVVTLPARAPAGTILEEAGEGVVHPSRFPPAEGGARAPSVSSPSLDARPLVLVVEDNRDMNRHVRALMSGLYRTEGAFDGAEGLERVRTLRPDLVICDWMMPRMDGAAMVRAVRADRTLDGIPIVMLTAKADDESRIAVLRDGAQDYLLKPFSADELLVRVRNLLDVAQTRRLLQAELSSTQADLRPLVRELAQRRREAETTALALRIAREQAERASALKTEFLGMVSHEFRTPLTALRLQIQALERRIDELEPRHREAVHRLARSSSRLEDLIESLLEYARIQAGCIRTKLETLDLTHLVHDVIDQCRPRGDLRVTCDAASPHVLRSDACLVRIVVSNLVENAIKFTERGVVDVTLSAERGGQCIRVRDTGRGIAPGDLARIFEPFEQVSLVRNKSLAGVGLGLALVREIVSALGGEIDVSSTPGVGSVFTVTLPDAPEERGMREIHEQRAASV